MAASQRKWRKISHVFRRRNTGTTALKQKEKENNTQRMTTAILKNICYTPYYRKLTLNEINPDSKIRF